jgi:hypothetical protein
MRRKTFARATSSLAPRGLGSTMHRKSLSARSTTNVRLQRNRFRHNADAAVNPSNARTTLAAQRLLTRALRELASARDTPLGRTEI